MIRTQISLTEDQMDLARREARRRGVSLAGLVREALDRLLSEDTDRRRRERALGSVGGFRSGRRDTAERHDEVLAERARW